MVYGNFQQAVAGSNTRFAKRRSRRTPSTLESVARSADRLQRGSLCAAAPLPRWFPRENMVNVTIIFGLLVVPCLIAYLFHSHNLTLAGPVGVCLVFLFGALGHFFKTDSMISMLPPSVPVRRAVIYLSGVLEIVFAIAVVSLPNPAYLGWMIILYLIAIFPSNVYAATHRIPFGGHS